MTQEKPVKKRNLKVLALAIICIVLAASLVSVLAYYLFDNPLSQQLKERDTTISSLQNEKQSLQNQIASLVTQINGGGGSAAQIASLNQQIADLNSTLNAFYSEYANLQEITLLAKSGLLYSNTVNIQPSSSVSIWNNPIDYAGYVAIQSSDTTNTTSAEVIFNFDEFSFDTIQFFGNTGTVLFPVLPGNIEVLINNTNSTDISNSTITATYYY